MKINSQYELKDGVLVKIAEEVPNPQGSNLGTSSLPVPVQPAPQAPIEEGKAPVQGPQKPGEPAPDKWSALLQKLEAEDPTIPQEAEKAPVPPQEQKPMEASLPPDLVQQAFPEKSEGINATQPSEKTQV